MNAKTWSQLSGSTGDVQSIPRITMSCAGHQIKVFAMISHIKSLVSGQSKLYDSFFHRFIILTSQRSKGKLLSMRSQVRFSFAMHILVDVLEVFSPLLNTTMLCKEDHKSHLPVPWTASIILSIPSPLLTRPHHQTLSLWYMGQ